METQSRPTVLLVDDEELLRLMGADILQDGGYEVVEACNAAEALSRLDDGAEVRVLFTDINMPGSPDGLGLAQLVSHGWPQVKIIVASGRVAPTACELPSEGRFLSKPYRAEELLALVGSLLAS